jgi:hypothetical protein
VSLRLVMVGGGSYLKCVCGRRMKRVKGGGDAGLWSCPWCGCETWDMAEFSGFVTSTGGRGQFFFEDGMWKYYEIQEGE